MARHNDIGKLGEEIAVKFLEKQGYTIFDRNYNYEKAEIDIVAYIPEELAFVEVKTRSNSEIEAPEKAISEAKKKQLFKAASFYHWERQLVSMPSRFDVISIGLDDPDDPDIVHFIDAFRPEGSGNW